MALLLTCCLGLGAGELRLKHHNTLIAPDEAEALLATHLEAFAKPQFNEDCRYFLLKQGVPPEEAAIRLASVTILYEPKSGELLLRSTDEEALRAVADAVLATEIDIGTTPWLAVYAAQEKGDHALAERLRNDILRQGEVRWHVDRSGKTQKSAQTNTTASAPNSAQTDTTVYGQAPATIPPQTKAAGAPPKTASTARNTLLLKHHTDPDQLAIPQLVATTLARQMASFGSERFRQESIEALVKHGLSAVEAASTFDAITLRYNVKTRDLFLSGADEPTLRAIASGSLLPSGVRTGIDVFMAMVEEARLRNDTAFIEVFASKTGGHASLWRIVGMVKGTR